MNNRSGASRNRPGSAVDETQSVVPINRRTLLTTIGSLAGISMVAGCSSSDEEQTAATNHLADDRARELAERFAPVLYFDEHEQWFPTDPLPYETDRDGEPVVDGFAAFDGYAEKIKQSGELPSPTVFYNALQYEGSSLGAIQFWYYSVFDQFTTNFHWHDWEVFHVFLDMETEEPDLYVASSHSGRVPNNEYLDPDPDKVPRILSELGSHSSALSVNDLHDRFQRLPLDGTLADITNNALETIEDYANIPVAYGLPRDEGFRLPYLVPELDGSPVYDHDNLPSVDRSDLIPSELTISSFEDLQSPPNELPERETGLTFAHGQDVDADVGYELRPSSEVEHITEFTGPQLEFEFAVPGFVEDAVSSHITTTGVPWKQRRYSDPAADISESNHQKVLSDRYEVIEPPRSVNTIIAGVKETISDPKAPEDEGIMTQSLNVELVALLESEPEAIPTFGGLAVVQDIPEGEHRLTVNGPGVEPYGETVKVGEETQGLTTGGVDGTVPMVARENSTKFGVDPEGTEAELTDLAVEDDFAGRLYDAPLSGPDAVYVHGGGAYTVEVRDTEEDIGASRVNPSNEQEVRIENPQTGKASLATYLADVAEETSEEISTRVKEDDTEYGSKGGKTESGSENAVLGLTRALDAVSEAARRAAERADNGNRSQAEQSLQNVRDRLQRVQTRLMEASEDLPDDLERAVGNRLSQSQRRAKQAQNAKKL